jgi:hypothetical protein
MVDVAVREPIFVTTIPTPVGSDTGIVTILAGNPKLTKRYPTLNSSIGGVWGARLIAPVAGMFGLR